MMRIFRPHIFEFVANSARWGAGGYNPNYGSSPAPAAVLTYASAILLDLPLLYFTLAEGSGTAANNLASTAWDGTYSGGYTHASALASTLLGSVNLNGSNGYVVVNTSSPNTGANAVVEAWVYCSASSPNCGIISDHFPGSGVIKYELGLSPTAADGKTILTFAHYTGAAWYTCSAATPFPLNTVLHVVGKAQGKVFKLFQNGVRIARSSVTASCATGGNDGMYVGKRHDAAGPHPYFDGNISDVAVYGSALSDGTIRGHYAIGIGHQKDDYAYRIIADGPEAYWRLNEVAGSTAYSEVGLSNRDGAYTGGVSLGTTSLIQESGNTAVRFDGTADYISIASAPHLGQRFTLESWVYASASTPTAAIISEVYTGGADPVAYALGFSNTVGASSATNLSCGYYTGSVWVEATDANAFPLGETVHCVGVKEASAISVYFNGLKVATSAATTSVVTTGTDGAVIGRRHTADTGTPYVDGVLDQVAMYATAITEETVRAHYAHGKGYASSTYPFEVIRDGATAYWRLDESSVATMKRTVGRETYVSAINSGKINPQASALTDALELCAYFSGTGAGSTSNPALYKNDIGTASVPIRTAEAWFRPKNFSSNRHVGSIHDIDSNRSHFRITTGRVLDIYSASAGAAVLACPNTITSTTTYHAAYTYDGTDSVLYVNGVQQDASTVHPGGMDGSADVIIGGYKFSGTVNGSANGYISDFAVYASALTATKIAEHWARGNGYAEGTHPFVCIRDLAVTYLPFEALASASATRSVVNVGYDYTAVGATIASTPLAAIGSACFHFDGSNDYIRSITALPAYTSGSAEMIIKSSTVSAGQRFFTLNAQVPYFRFRLVTASTVGFLVNGTGGTEITAGIVASSVNHIVGTFKKSGAQRLYINGSVVASGTTPSTLNKVSGSDYNTIGASRTPDAWYDGYIDRVSIYGHALSSAEVATHYETAMLYDNGTRYPSASYPFAVINDGATLYVRFNDVGASGTVASTVVGTFNGVYVSSLCSSVAPLVSDGTHALKNTGGQFIESGVNFGDVDCFDHAGNHSIECWFSTTAALAANKLCTKSQDGTTWMEYALQLNSSGNIVYETNSDGTPGGYHALTTSGAYNDGAKYHVVAVHDNASDKKRVYVNGSAVASATWTPSCFSNASDLCVGYGTGTNNYALTGTIDEFAVYATALTAAQVADHYTKGTA